VVVAKGEKRGDGRVPKWAWPPLVRFSDYTQQEQTLVELAARGIHQIARSVPLFEALEELGSSNGDDQPSEEDATDAAAAASPATEPRESRVSRSWNSSGLSATRE
jgi:hypothetical protein